MNDGYIEYELPRGCYLIQHPQSEQTIDPFVEGGGCFVFPFESQIVHNQWSLKKGRRYFYWEVLGVVMPKPWQPHAWLASRKDFFLCKEEQAETSS